MLNINDVNSLFPWRALTTLRTKGPNTDPWGTPQVIDLISSFCSRIDKLNEYLRSIICILLVTMPATCW